MKKSISRRSFLKAVGALSAAGALAACGGSSTSTAASTASSAAPAASAEASGSAASIKLWTYPIGGWGKDETVQEIIGPLSPAPMSMRSLPIRRSRDTAMRRH